MPEPVETAPAAAPSRGAVLRSLFGTVRLAYLPVLVTYFCYGASGITSIALLYFQKDTLGITPAEAAAITSAGSSRAIAKTRRGPTAPASHPLR